jgi:hypothetical protein
VLCILERIKRFALQGKFLPIYKNISKKFNAEDGAFERSKTGLFHSCQA